VFHYFSWKEGLMGALAWATESKSRDNGVFKEDTQQANLDVGFQVLSTTKETVVD
jgi:hypothetical protein